MKKYMQKLFIKSEKKKDNFSLLFDNYLLDKINNSKKYTEKHQKFNVDTYNLLIREDKYNISNNIYGWKFNDNDEVININVTEELELTKEPEDPVAVKLQTFDSIFIVPFAVKLNPLASKAIFPSTSFIASFTDLNANPATVPVASALPVPITLTGTCPPEVGVTPTVS